MKKIIAAILLSLAVGCASFTAPLSFGDRAAYARGQNNAIRAACLDMMKRGSLETDDAEQCRQFVAEINKLLQGAVALGGAAGEEQMIQIQRALLAAEEYLKSKEKK